MAESQDLSRELAHWISVNLSYKYNNNKSSPNRYIVDIVGFLLLISPISALFPFAWMTGHYVDVNDLDKANSTRRIHSFVWHSKVKKLLDMQWTVRRTAIYVIYLRLAISLLVIIVMAFFNNVIHLWIFSPTTYIINYYTYAIVWNFTISILQNLVRFCFHIQIYTCECSKKDDKRRMEDSLRVHLRDDVFIFSDKQTSDEIDSNSTVFSKVSYGKRISGNHSCASVDREAFDATVTTSTASTTVSTNTTIISPIAVAAVKALE
ncbi:hypothetical protein C1646_767637 [Rhizophagus diaphanus]|nr:hypothetical protein C1646_767637 [Rhizophagus diaphanus] [Rhizophagus sp. MUCL 43196]